MMQRVCLRAWLPQYGVVKSMTHSAALGRAGDLPIRSARGETLVQPPNRAGAIEAVCKELDEAEQQGAIPAPEPQTIR